MSDEKSETLTRVCWRCAHAEERRASDGCRECGFCAAFVPIVERPPAPKPVSEKWVPKPLGHRRDACTTPDCPTCDEKSETLTRDEVERRIALLPDDSGHPFLEDILALFASQRAAIAAKDDCTIERLTSFKVAHENIVGDGWLGRAHAVAKKVPGSLGRNVWHVCVREAERAEKLAGLLREARDPMARDPLGCDCDYNKPCLACRIDAALAGEGEKP